MNPIGSSMLAGVYPVVIRFEKTMLEDLAILL
jgi:hypothetical protein